MGRKLGDQQFKAGEYSKAINKYEKALRYLDQGGFAGEDKVQKRKKRKIVKALRYKDQGGFAGADKVQEATISCNLCVSNGCLMCVWCVSIKVQKAMISCNLNAAQCFLKLGKGDDAKSKCSKVNVLLLCC